MDNEVSLVMVEKKEGAEMDCKSCGTALICHMSSYKGNFENKLQWQNKDGTAHYKFNGTTYLCIIPNEIKLKFPADSDIINKVSTDFAFELHEADNIQNQLDKLIEIESIVTKKLTVTAIPPNPAKVGMYMKFIWDELKK